MFKQKCVPCGHRRRNIWSGFQRTETERIQTRNRARAHREDVAEDSADTRGRSLIGFHRARVVMRFNLKGDPVLLVQRNHARVFHAARLQCFLVALEVRKDRARIFVAAVLAPHHRNHPELGQSRLPVEKFQNQVILRCFEAKTQCGIAQTCGGSHPVYCTLRVQFRPGPACWYLDRKYRH